MVSEISLGSWLTYGVGVETAPARACLDRAFELGLNLIDTANVYGRGAAEEFLGDALAGRERSSYVLATKLYFPMSDEDRGLSAAQVAKQIDGSLRRLRTDYVDLYQCHRYDVATPLEETMHALTEVVRQGKARYIGFSEWSADQIQAALEIPGVELFVSSQPQYSILRRRIEKEVIPLCAASGISQIVWSPLAQGVLTGKYRPGDRLPDDSRAASEAMGWAMDRFLEDDVLTGRAAAPPDRRRPRDHDVPACPRLGAAAAERRLRDRGSESARAGGRQRSSVRNRARRGDAERDRRRGCRRPRVLRGAAVPGTNESEGWYEARREATSIVIIAAVVLLLMALVSWKEGWELVELRWWTWLVLAVPSLLLWFDLWLGGRQIGFASTRRASLVLLGVIVLGNLVGLATARCGAGLRKQRHAWWRTAAFHGGGDLDCERDRLRALLLGRR